MIETSVWTEGIQQMDRRYSPPLVDRARPAVSPRVVLNRRPALYYGLGALACLLAAAVLPLGPIGMIFFLWPSVGLGMLAVAYLEVGPAVFRKRSGRLPFTTRLLFAHYMIGNAIAYYLCRWKWRRGYSRLAEGVYLGRLLDNSEADELIGRGLTAVLDLTAEYFECSRFRQLAYKNVQILDLTLPTAEQLHQAVEFVRRHAAIGQVYIHCALGCCRAPTVAAAYLIASGEVDSAEAAVARVRRRRPNAAMPKGLVELLEQQYGIEA